MKKITTFCLVLIAILNQNTFGQKNNIDSYVLNPDSNVFVPFIISTSSLPSPVDLDFYPNQAKRSFELWVLNQGTASSGGSTVVISNANKSTRTAKYIKDGNAYHFMSMASAIAFGDSLWATSPDILDANHGIGKFTGPTLWTSDLKVYGIVGNPPAPGINGSHLDMIHQSPYSKGIASESDLVYWVLDGYEGNLKRYDYVQTHEPGGEDHSAGKVRVYNEFTFTKHATLPSHIVIDSNKKYLYGCDPLGKRIFRVDITSGSYYDDGLLINNEPLAEYRNYIGLEIKNIVTSRLTRPVGIDIYGNRLIVTDNGSDEIIVYDITSDYSEIGRLKLKYTANPDPMGIKVGPDGKIYFVDKANKKVYLIENNQSVVGVEEITDIISSSIVFPNPASNTLGIQFNKNVNYLEVNILDVLGETVATQNVSNESATSLDISHLSVGLYFLKLQSKESFSIQKFIKQ